MPSSQENRRFVRKPVSVQLRLGQVSGAGEIFFDAGDLSQGGAFLKSDLFFEVGHLLTVTFALPGTHRIAARGRVVWVGGAGDDDAALQLERGPGMGLEFVDLDEHDRKVIANYLATQG